jgi:hypothetical protein
VPRDRTPGSRERAYVRIKAAVKVTAVDREGRLAVGRTIELSGNGALIKLGSTEVPPEPGSRLQLLISLPERPIIADANVVRAVEGDIYAVEFERLDPDEQERLIVFVFERMPKLVPAPGAAQPGSSATRRDPTPAPEAPAAAPTRLRRLLRWLWS